MMTALIAYFWLHEAISFFDWIAILCSFVGILIIQNPLAMWYVQREEGETIRIYETLGTVCALGGALFVSISMMQTRKLGKRVHFLVPPLYTAVTSALICPFFMVWMLVFRNSGVTHYGWYEFLMITALSVSGFVAWVFQTKSY